MLLREGYTADAFELLERSCDAVQKTGQCPWDAPELFTSDTGRPVGPMGAPGAAAPWWVLAAVTGTSIDVPSGTLFLSPRIPPGHETLRAPVFLPGFWGWMGTRSSPYTWRPWGRYEPGQLLRGAGRAIGKLILRSVNIFTLLVDGTCPLSSVDRAPDS